MYLDLGKLTTFITKSVFKRSSVIPQRRILRGASTSKMFSKVICVLTEEEEFEKYSGMEGLLDFYR